jgi:hypothetical protein
MTRAANGAAGQIKATSLHAVEELACLQRIGDARPHAEPLRQDLDAGERRGPPVQQLGMQCGAEQGDLGFGVSGGPMTRPPAWRGAGRPDHHRGGRLSGVRQKMAATVPRKLEQSPSSGRQLGTENNVEGIYVSDRDRGLGLQMDGAAGQNAGTAEPFHHPPLCGDILPAVLWSEEPPEVEPTAVDQRLPAVEDAGSNPGHLIGEPVASLHLKRRRQMGEVGCVVQRPTIEFGGAAANALGPHAVQPRLEGATFGRPIVVEIRPCRTPLRNSRTRGRQGPQHDRSQY